MTPWVCVPLAGNQVGLYILDVSGHGVGAALLSFTLTHLLSPSAGQTLLVEHTETGPALVSPARVAERLNRQFPMDRTRQYFTLVYGILDESSGLFRYVMAGHPAPVLLRRHAAPVPLAGRGFPIGMIDDASFEDETAILDPGDRLYFYTDGVIEALDSAEQEFGYARLLDELSGSGIGRFGRGSNGSPTRSGTGREAVCATTCRCWAWSGSHRSHGRRIPT